MNYVTNKFTLDDVNSVATMSTVFVERITEEEFKTVETFSSLVSDSYTAKELQRLLGKFVPTNTKPEFNLKEGDKLFVASRNKGKFTFHKVSVRYL